MISVCLATHNEAKNLARCLESVRAVADEIIIVDGESEDDTVAVARRFKATVISATNKLNFHINKQLALDRAQGDLVLQLDADEVVDDELARFIREIHGQLGHRQPSQDAPVAWWIRRKNLFLNRFLTKGGQYPDPVTRLFVKGKARLPQKDVHEQLEVDGRVGWAEGHLIHYSNPTFTEYMRKFNTYTSFKAQQLKEQGVTIGLASSLTHLLWWPLTTFFSLYVRHKGFVDGFPGFLFALMSGWHHAVAYLKLWELYVKRTD